MRLNLRTLLISALAATPAALFSFSNPPGPPAGRTGLMADTFSGGAGSTCAGCHRNPDGGTNPNIDSLGKLTITASPYSPGARQKITVKLEHPSAMRWGFSLTARLDSDQTKAAGSFIGNETVLVRCGTTGTLKENTCNGAIEFVNHTADSTNAGQAGSNTWEFEWQAPESLVGKVIFAAAGNAANNSRSNAGDFIYTTTMTIDAAPANGPKPAITARGVVDAFTYGANIAAGGWFTIFGTNLGPAARTWDTAIVGDKLPTALSGVGVTINGKPATLYYVSPTQINGLAPLDDATGMLPVVVTNVNGSSDPMMVSKAATAPAFYAPMSQGGRFFVRGLAADGTVVGKTGVDPLARRGARPGETITILGSGFGATNPDVPSDTIPTGNAELKNKPTIRVGDAAVTFPGNGTLLGPGLIRFDITVPAAAADGDIAITAETAGNVRSASTVFLTVAK